MIFSHFENNEIFSCKFENLAGNDDLGGGTSITYKSA